MRARLGWGVVAALALALLGSPAHAFRTPFGDRVYEAIERGLAYLRTQEADGSIGGETTPLAGLAIMEMRASAHWGAPSKGYRNSTADDQQRLQRMARWVLTNINGLRNGSPDAYRTGSGLLFLSLYRQTGGPNQVGAARTVDEGIASGVAALQGAQSQGNCSEGGWNYTNP
ncbi:MAG: hypothetical protein KC613_11180, partial [Myxococcales bacterium]|nr:hypothetical protein [Myxococcales bacterium]